MAETPVDARHDADDHPREGVGAQDEDDPGQSKPGKGRAGAYRGLPIVKSTKAIGYVRSLWLWAIVVMMAGAACGRDGGNITRAEYLREGNAICSRGNEQIRALATQPPAGASTDGAASYARVFVPGVRDQLRQLRSLGYPKGDRARLEALFDDAAALLDQADRDPTTIDGHAFDDVNRRLTAYGLRICGS